MSVVQECEGVVELKGLFEDLNSAYFVMEHCSGGDLEQLVQVRTVAAPVACTIGQGFTGSDGFYVLLLPVTTSAHLTGIASLDSCCRASSVVYSGDAVIEQMHLR